MTALAVEVVGESGGYWYVRPLLDRNPHIISSCGLRPGKEIPRELCKVGERGYATYVKGAYFSRWIVTPIKEVTHGEDHITR